MVIKMNDKQTKGAGNMTIKEQIEEIEKAKKCRYNLALIDALRMIEDGRIDEIVELAWEKK